MALGPKPGLDLGEGVWKGGAQEGQALQGWTEPSLLLWGHSCSLFRQTQGSSPVTLDLIIPFLRPGGCVLVRNPALPLHTLPWHLLHRWRMGQIQSATMFGQASVMFKIGICCYHLNIGRCHFIKLFSDIS